MSNILNVFGKGIAAPADAVELLGGKGAKLAEMGAFGLNVPPGVTIHTTQCNEFFAVSEGKKAAFIDTLVNEVLDHYEGIAQKFGYMPLVSVRSGARVSMPGMMDTVLNVGINDSNLPEWRERLGEECADDCYRRLVEMYSDVVLGIPKAAFEGVTDLASMLHTFEAITDSIFPQALEEQLSACIEAVFNSWFSDRAVAYRAQYGYPEDWGTAVNVQAMVFGNRNNNSATGVMFTRDFNTGDCEAIIDWLPNAQGEDVVNGSVTPNTTADFIQWNSDVADELIGIGDKLEDHYGDMQDVEWTVDDGELFILQTRNGKRSSLAAFTIAFDLCETEQRIDREEALARVTGKDYLALTAPHIDPNFTEAPDVTGVPASGQIVSGVAVLSAAEAVASKEACILVADETTPEDFAGMAASVGILTRTGGITSHAAVVARGMNKTCVVGAENLKFAGIAGKNITMDGATGRIWIDTEVPVIEGEIPEFVNEMLAWADSDFPSGGILDTAPESVSKGGTFYVDVSDRLSTQKSLSAALEALKGANGIVSFGGNDEVAESDATFMSFFGVEATATDEGDWMIIEKVLSMAKWTKAFKNSWAIHLPNDASVDYANVLRSHGWNVVSRVDSFKAAINADGYVVLEKKFLDQLTREGMSFEEIEKLINDAGRDLKELPERVNETRILFDVLGG